MTFLVLHTAVIVRAASHFPAESHFRHQQKGTSARSSEHGTHFKETVGNLQGTTYLTNKNKSVLSRVVIRAAIKERPRIPRLLCLRLYGLKLSSSQLPCEFQVQTNTKLKFYTSSPGTR
jgi:hypothetical protein